MGGPSKLDPADYTRGVRDQLSRENARWIMARCNQAWKAIWRLPPSELTSLEILRALAVQAYLRGRRPMRTRSLRRGPKGG